MGTCDTMVNAIKCLVRPVVTFLVMAALVGVLVYLVVKFGDLEMAKQFTSAFLVLAASIGAFWFAQRANPPPPPTPPTS